MAREENRVIVLLGDAHAVKLRQMAERVHVSPGTLARSLLSKALDDAGPSGANVTSALDSMDGAFEHAETGWTEASEGRFVDLEDI